ncbi:hypothetical protein FB45DRAFT_1124869 [Roridomyces roridus]|uniref:Uncharacterized protein n=1 Tax=Roridomyces roridus TaxID=1738132 RepID=A0AAD7FWG1_9AGAR|nr:hypothetical protein FB45DRAFT_1124869 [Roridomyces roridus]
MSSDDAAIFSMRDIAFNNIILEAFAHGIYSVIFTLALYAMIFKKKTPALFFLAVITMFALSTIQLAVRWAIARDAFIVHGDNPLDTVEAFMQPTLALSVLSGSALVVNTFIADCVLIYRCLAVWNRDWRAYHIPDALHFLGVLTVHQTVTFVQSGGDPNSFVDYARPYFCMCLLTTLLATFLIVFRILWLTREDSTRNGSATAFSSYRAVIEMVVESAFLYSATLAIYIALLYGSETGNADGYAQALLIDMTGIAPTLIVARVSFGNSSSVTVVRSGIQFSKNEDLLQSQNTNFDGQSV